jgi:hypothetical protein
LSDSPEPMTLGSSSTLTRKPPIHTTHTASCVLGMANQVHPEILQWKN